MDPEQEAREARIAWRVERVQSDLDHVPDGLWHYSDAGGLAGILVDKVLWATNTRFLNDATEINYGLEVAEEAVELAAGSGRWSDSTSHFLRRVVAADGANLLGFLRAKSDVYVVCFCEKGDLLSQWRAYTGSNSAGGYALRFRHRAPITGWVDHLGRRTLQLRRVTYDRDAQLRSLSRLLELLAPVYDREHSESRMDALGRNLLEGILEFATVCKHPSFEEEHEWRVVYERSSDPSPLDVKHRISRGTFVPYVELDLPAAVGTMAGRLPLAEVRCGPSPEPKLKHDGVRRLLQSHKPFRDVDVSGSGSPLRL